MMLDKQEVSQFSNISNSKVKNQHPDHHPEIDEEPGLIPQHFYDVPFCMNST